MSKSRSGTPWSEAHYAAKGYGAIKLRLPLDTIEILTAAAEAAGVSRAEYLDGLVRGVPVKRAKKTRGEPG